MDYSLLALGALVAISLASAAIWHLLVKSYAAAVVGASLVTALVTYLGYPLYRGVAANALIISNASVVAAVIAIGIGIPFKRRRSGKLREHDDR